MHNPRVPYVFQGDQLVTYRAEAVYSPKTTVYMNYREPQRCDVNRMCQFALRALAFTRSVLQVQITVDGTPAMTVDKCFPRAVEAIMASAAYPKGVSSPQEMFCCREVPLPPCVLLCLPDTPLCLGPLMTRVGMSRNFVSFPTLTLPNG